MGVVEIVALILVLKIPIVGLFWLVWWAGHPSEAGEEPAVPERTDRPRLPEPPRPLGPRRRGPHGGAAAPAPASSSHRRVRTPARHSKHMPRKLTRD